MIMTLKDVSQIEAEVTIFFREQPKIRIFYLQYLRHAVKKKVLDFLI